MIAIRVDRTPVIFKGKAPKPGRLYYLAHPFTTCGDPEANKRDAAHLEQQLLTMGIQVINPILLPLGRVNTRGKDYPEPNEGRAMFQCLTLLGACDGIILSGHWQESTGCCNENYAARKVGMPRFEVLGCI